MTTRLAIALLIALAAPALAENHLANEASPYLRAHAANPVDWYPWGDAAFAKAKAEDKPVFLSIGYATCHWCHVMAHESFEDAEVAKYLNEHFVAIKVDREELPDVDRVYVGFVAAQTGAAGWPLSVFLAPDRQPFIGGTYFPRDRFLAALKVVSEQWASNREALVAHGKEALGQLKAATPGEGPADPQRPIDAAVAALARRFDAIDGGFDQPPKFPRACALDFLLAARAHAGADALLPKEDARRQAEGPTGMALMLRHTLDAMVSGGIHDQLGGGFHRYTLDAAWRVPHFEKMLYDQAQLARVYLEASTLPEPRARAWRRVAQETLDHALAALRDPEGGFVAAEDADSPPAVGQPPSEGAFYLWTTAQVDAALAPLGDDAPEAIRQVEQCFGIRAEGNIPPMFDERGELRGQNVLRWIAPPPSVVSEAPAVAIAMPFERGRQLLVTARELRPRPARDEQIVVAWNGMMIRALADASALVARDDWLAAARLAATRVLGAWSDERGLPRSGGAGGAWRGVGGAADYAELELGLLALNARDGDPRWLDWALRLQERLDRDFWDEVSGTYFDAVADPALPARLRADDDEAEPAANSAAALALMRLATITGDEALEKRLQRLLGSYRGLLARDPAAMPAMLAAMLAERGPRERLMVVGPAGDPATLALLGVGRDRWRPGLVRASVAPERVGELARFPDLALPMIGGKPTAYYCKGTVCLAPTSDPGRLDAALRETPP